MADVGVTDATGVAVLAPDREVQQHARTTSSERRRRPRATRSPRLLGRWWVRVTLIFAASRVLTTTVMLVMAGAQGANPWTAAHPGYVDYANIWDGLWYRIVGQVGYPTHIVYDSTGVPEQNAWAFLPAYPWVVNAVTFVTRMPWQVAAIVVAVACGLGASLVFYRLVRVKLRPSTALFAVVLFCVAPVSPLFQVAYAESMYVLLLAAALLLLVRRHYLWLAPIVVVMAFTRPGGLAFALLLGVLAVVRWVRRRRDPFPPREVAALLGTTGVALLTGVAWPLIAGWVTGDPSAYADTELSWRAAYIGPTHLVPFASWVQGAIWWFHTWLGLPVALGIAALILLVALTALVLIAIPARYLSLEARLWCAAYALYLLAVFFPQSSTFRLLMPMFPLLGVLAVPRHPAYRVALTALFVAMQVGWLAICWGIDGSDWTPP